MKNGASGAAMKDKKHLFLRMCVSALGICLIGFGIAIMTRASLGCSPIAAIPYSLFNLLPQVSYGQWVIIFNLSLIALEWFILKKQTSHGILASQAALTLLLGCYVDIFMNLAIDVAPSQYSSRLMVVAGCSLSISLGTAMCIAAHLATTPADGLTSAIAKNRGRRKARVNLFADLAMAMIALGICVQAFHAPVAVREGTVIAAILIGFLVKMFIRTWAGLRKES